MGMEALAARDRRSAHGLPSSPVRILAGPHLPTPRGDATGTRDCRVLAAAQGVPGEILRMIGGTEAGTFDSALLAGGWNLLTQAGLPCFAECEARGIEVHVAGVFASGLLVSTDGTYAYKKAPADKVAAAEAWRSLAEKHGFSLPAVAIAFAALPKCVTKVVLGMVTPKQVKQNLAWVEESGGVGPAFWAEAKATGLLDIAVPTP